MAGPSGCRICGDPTIEAHLIPRAFIHDLRGPEKHILAGWAERSGRKILQSGLYDRNILCKKCDGILGKYDTFGIEFCRTFAANFQSPARDIFLIRPADTDNVVRFFASIVWRYSISTLPEATEVDLGPLEGTFTDILFNGASCAAEPATFLFRYRSRVIAEDQICVPPFKSPFIGGQLDAYTIYLSGFRVFVKADARPVPANLLPVIINGKKEITGGYLDFEATPEFEAMRAIVENMQRKPEKPKKP